MGSSYLLAFVVIAIFLAQLAVVGVIIFHYKNKTSKIYPSLNAVTNNDSKVSEYYDGKKYFFQNEEKTQPLYKFYGEIKGLKINIFSTETLTCDLSELSILLDAIDPWMGKFFVVISEENGNKTVQYQADTPHEIEVLVSDESLLSNYSGTLPLAEDMKHFMVDYFTGEDVIKKYSLNILKI